MLPIAVFRQELVHVEVTAVPALQVTRWVASRQTVAPGVQVPVLAQWAIPPSVLQADPVGHEYV
jgi:hypothetical protein